MENYNDQIEGRNAVVELLRSGKDINKLYIQKGEKSGSINEIYALAKQRKVVIVELEKVKFAKMAQTPRAQGVIAVVPPYEYVSVDDILDYAKSKNEKPFILILDEIEDPHNLGSIIRTAECTGVHGIIIPKRRSAMVNSTVFKTSVGAAEYVNVAVVRNLNDTINYFEEETKKTEIDESFAKYYIDICKNVIETLNTSNELKDIYAQETRIKQLEDRFINALEYEKSKKQATDEQGQVREEKIIKRTIVRTDSLMNRSYEINTKEDIDKYVEEIKEKLLKEFEKNNNLTIR